MDMHSSLGFRELTNDEIGVISGGGTYAPAIKNLVGTGGGSAYQYTCSSGYGVMGQNTPGGAVYQPTVSQIFGAYVCVPGQALMGVYTSMGGAVIGVSFWPS